MRFLYIATADTGSKGINVYQGFYGLKDHPFRLTPDPAYICLTSQHREALSGLIYTTRTRLGLTVLIGEAGTGKTTVLFTLNHLLEGRSYVIVRCNNPTLSREEFYDFLLAGLGIECSSPLKSRQLKALEEALIQFRDAGRSAVLIVDEAQRLPPELLEEIRLLLNLETAKEKLLQIVMAGQPELDDLLSRPELRQLRQRISAICRLEPLTPEEVGEYLLHRLDRAGLAEQKLFPDDVIRLIYGYSRGIPRLINSLCDAALRTGFALQARCVTPSIIEEAARDLELSDSDQNETSVNKEMTGGVPPKVIAMPIASAESKSVPPDAQPDPGQDLKMPLEAYASRQRSLGFLGQLLDRWK